VRLHQAAISPFLEIAPSGITLPALLELGCSCMTSPQSHAAHIERLVESWSKFLPEIGHVRQLFTTGARSRPQTAPFAAPLMELWPIQSRSDWTGEPASLFQSRFTRSLEKRGFGRKLSLALSKAMQEMADNIIQHSGRDEDHPALGLVGYHVEERWMTYAVA